MFARQEYDTPIALFLVARVLVGLLCSIFQASCFFNFGMLYSHWYNNSINNCVDFDFVRSMELMLFSLSSIAPESSNVQHIGLGALRGHSAELLLLLYRHFGSLQPSLLKLCKHNIILFTQQYVRLLFSSLSCDSKKVFEKTCHNRH